MEFTDVGAHCYYDLCRQHTYLPFECRYCKHQFCKHHIHSTQHQCPNASNIDLNINNNPPSPNPIEMKDDDSNNGLSMYKCSYSQCNKQSPISILCNDCNQLFCIKHRYPDDHHCGRDLTLNNNGRYDEDGYEQLNIDFGTNPSNKQQVSRQLSDSQYDTIRMASTDCNSFGVPSSPEVINVYKFNELRKMGYNDKEVYNAWYDLKGLYPSFTSENPQFMDKMLDTLQSQQKMANYPQQTFDDEKISSDNIDGYPDLNRELSKCQDDEEFDVEKECEKLHNVIGIFTTNKNKSISKETAFAQLICNSHLQQRQGIKGYYKKKYMVNLDHYINMNFKGIFKRMLLYAMSTDIERQEYLLRVGLKKMDDINVIIQVICNLESDNIGKLIELHDKAMFRKSLKSQVRKLTTDNLKLRAFLMNIMDGIRVKTESMNGNTSKRDAMINDDISFLSEILMEVHWNKDDEARFIDIFSKRSFDYLEVLCQEYEKLNDISLIEACNNSLGNEYGVGYIISCILMNIMDKHSYYQKLWKKGMKTEGHKYIMFWRVIIDRMDIDLDDILKLNGKSDVERYDFKHFIDTRLHQQDSAAADLILKICKLS